MARRRAATAVALFVFLQGLYVLTSTGRLHVTDEASAFFQARSLVEIGALTVPEATPGFRFYGERDRLGQPRAPNGPAHAMLVVPYYAAGKAIAAAAGIPANARDVVLACAAVMSSATCAAAAATLLFLLLVRRHLPTRSALAAAFALAVGTPLFAYSGWLFSEPIAACLLTAAAVAAFGSSTHLAIGPAAVAGACLGACVLVRAAHAFVVPLFVAAVLLRDGRRGVRPALALAAVAAAGVAIYLAWNDHLFGNPLDFGYPEFADRGKRINAFDTPLLTGLAGFLVSPGKSIVVHAPVILLAVAALPALARFDRGLAFLAIAVPVTYLLIYAQYTQWEGGYCVGPRYLLPAIPFLVTAIGPYLREGDRAGWRILLLLTAAGAVVQSIGLATSFLEDQFTNRYYDEQFNYRFAYAPFVSQSALFLRYLAAAVRGDPSAPLGTGFDRWFVFLHTAGVPWPPMILAIASVTVVTAGAGLYLLALRRTGSVQAVETYENVRIDNYESRRR